MSEIINAIEELLEHGFSSLPCMVKDKHPKYPWKRYAKDAPPMNVISALADVQDFDAVCIITGCVSGNLEVIDFDCNGEYYPAWADTIKEKAPELFKSLVIETTQNGGMHVSYRCDDKIDGNLKLASKDKKTYIETRGVGGLIVVAPSTGYALVQNSYDLMPTISFEERGFLIETAFNMDESKQKKKTIPRAESTGRAVDPIDDFNETGDLLPFLAEAGWTLESGDDKNYKYTRPGKESGVSATFNNEVFYVFSSNAKYFTQNTGVSKGVALANLKFKGHLDITRDWLLDQGFGVDLKDCSSTKMLLSLGIEPDEVIREKQVKADKSNFIVDEKLLRVPGLLNDIMDFSLKTAPYPNKVMAFAGALSMMSFLLGRKVKSDGDVRPNLYILALGMSSIGKDWPRKTNARILNALNMGQCLGDKFASAEGIEDSLLMCPKKLYQSDEINGMLENVSKGTGDARYSNIIDTLMSVYTSSDSVMACRMKANAEEARVINQPAVTIFGTAIPQFYFKSLNDRLLNNGFFGRTLVFESYPKTKFNKCSDRDTVPQSIIDDCNYWVEYGEGGNLDDINPHPVAIPATDEAERYLDKFSDYVAKREAKFQKDGDNPAMTVWGRANETVLKLALIYACSDRKMNGGVVTIDAARWATTLITQLIDSMMVNVNNTAFEEIANQDNKRFLMKITSSPDQIISRTELKRYSGMRAKEFNEVVSDLADDGLISVKSIKKGSSSRFSVWYSLI